MPEPRQVEAATAVVEAARERLQGGCSSTTSRPTITRKYPKPCMGGWGRQFLAVTPSGRCCPAMRRRAFPDFAFDNVRERVARLDLAPLRRLQPLPRQRLDAGALPQLRPRAEEDFGGCRCQALLLTGDAENTDPVCNLSPHHALTRDTGRRLVARERCRTSSIAATSSALTGSQKQSPADRPGFIRQASSRDYFFAIATPTFSETYPRIAPTTIDTTMAISGLLKLAAVTSAPWRSRPNAATDA